jgi:hypothetical protein
MLVNFNGRTISIDKVEPLPSRRINEEMMRWAIAIVGDDMEEDPNVAFCRRVSMLRNFGDVYPRSVLSTEMMDESK